MKKLKKLKMCLCLVMALAMVFGGMQVWAGEENSDDMVTIIWNYDSTDPATPKVLAIDGKSITDPENYSGKSYPVGTTFTVQAPESYETYNGDMTYFRVWILSNMSYYYTEPFEDSHNPETTFTLTDDMAGMTYLIGAYYWPNPDNRNTVSINWGQGVLNLGVPCDIISHTGTVTELPNSCKAFVNSSITCAVTDPVEGASSLVLV